MADSMMQEPVPDPNGGLYHDPGETWADPEITTERSSMSSLSFHSTGLSVCLRVTLALALINPKQVDSDTDSAIGDVATA